MDQKIHQCEWCGEFFPCEQPVNAPLEPPEGVVWCTCLQLIQSETTPGITPDGKSVTVIKDGTARLVFWCSDFCFDEDVPEPSTDSDDAALEDMYIAEDYSNKQNE